MGLLDRIKDGVKYHPLTNRSGRENGLRIASRSCLILILFDS
jgi:hypothetical protein